MFFEKVEFLDGIKNFQLFNSKATTATAENTYTKIKKKNKQKKI